MVAEDEREGGVRTHISFGHTIERLQGYGGWLHGEAVAAGMVIATQISVARGSLDEMALHKLLLFNEAFGLPTGPPADILAADFLEAMTSDKKVTSGKIRYVLLNKLGEATITDRVTEQEIVDVISLYST